MTHLPVLVVIALMGWATQVHSQAQCPLFGPAPGSPVAVGAGSGQVVLADVSGDGRLDMVTRHLQSRIMTVQLGDSTGRFAMVPGSPIILGYSPGDMKLGDVNNDRILDLGVMRNDRDHVDIFIGNGKGGFSLGTGSPFIANTSVYTLSKPSLHLVDINEDGNLDFVTANGRWNKFATLLGDGRGRFTPGPITRLRSGQAYYSVAFGDIDGDGHLDVVIATSGMVPGPRDGRLVTRRGDGTGAFKNALGPPLIVSSDPRIAALAHMNSDQHLDVVISHSSNRLSVLLNDGNGAFTPAPASPYILGAPAFAVVVADVNRDKKADLLAATVNNQLPPFDSSVTVLLGDGRAFVPAPGSPFRAGPGAYNLAVGDVNKDGKLDVAASSFEGNAVTVLLGRCR
ncbi:MAG: VCBS repeat-containing protein [Chloroflexi bacterium]|nr:VCBS repeat-containing protein [Chloroflexota bacterium]